MKLPSGSQWGRAQACPASAALPQTESINDFSDAGTAGHAFLEACRLRGRDAALAAVAPKHKELCERIQLDGLPLSGEYEAEIAFTYDVDAGTARDLGRIEGRNYPPRSDSEFPLRLDVIRARPGGDVAQVKDYKFTFGHDTYAPEPRNNWQLKVGGLAVCRARGFSSVELSIIKIFEDGTHVETEPYLMDAFAVDEFEEELRKAANRVRSAYRDIEEGRTPATVVGDHCHWCKAMPHCPAAKGLALVQGESIEKQITAELAGIAWEQQKVAEEFLEKRRKFLTLFVEHTPAKLSNGKVLALVEQRREMVDGSAVFDVLERLCDQKTARSAVELKSSKAAIKRAVQPVAAVRGVSPGDLEREVLEALRAAGGVRETRFSVMKEIRPQLTAGEEE